MATFFSIGQQTGSKRYSSWSVSSSDFDIDSVDISNVYYDSNLKSEVRKEVETYMSNVSFDLTADSVVLVTIGG